MAGASGLAEMNMTGVWLRRNEYARSVLFCCCARFRHPSHTKPPLCRHSARPRTHLIPNFSRTSQAKSLFSACHFATWPSPLAHFSWTRYAIVEYFDKCSWPLFVAFSTGHFGQSGGRLGAVLGHLRPERAQNQRTFIEVPERNWPDPAGAGLGPKIKRFLFNSE